MRGADIRLAALDAASDVLNRIAAACIRAAVEIRLRAAAIECASDEAAPPSDRIPSEHVAQDPLTPEAAELLETPLEALGRNVNGPDEFVIERRVRRP